MLATERDEFEKLLRELFAAIDKPCSEATIEAFWKGLAMMSIVEFSRARDLLIDDLKTGEPPKRFSVSDIWGAKKRLRAPPPPKSDQPAWRGDVWDQVASQQLLRIITTRIPADPSRYGHRDSAQFADNIGALVAMKNRWASLMRNAAGPNGVPAREQRDCWDNCMRMAEESMGQERAA